MPFLGMRDAPGVSPLPWHSKETPVEVVVVAFLGNLIYVAALQVVMVLKQAW